MRLVSSFVLITLILIALESFKLKAQFLEAVKTQIGVTNEYDPAYYRLDFPGGDIDRSKGVCIDVIIRGLRDAYDYDLQKEVINYMKRDPSKFREDPDKNISHRRVRNVMIFMDYSHNFKSVQSGQDLKPGDILVWNLGGGYLHIGVVSDDTEMIVHNISSGVREEYPSEFWTQLHHFRFAPD